MDYHFPPGRAECLSQHAMPRDADADASRIIDWARFIWVRFHFSFRQPAGQCCIEKCHEADARL